MNEENVSAMEFFRHCPGCGLRFHIKLESKKLVAEHRESIPRLEPASRVVSRTTYGQVGGVYSQPSVTPVTVYEGKPIVTDVEEFLRAYKCKHCGHEWSETHVEERWES